MVKRSYLWKATKYRQSQIIIISYCFRVGEDKDEFYNDGYAPHRSLWAEKADF